MNVFIEANEFVNLDNRRLRSHYTTTFESLYNKINAQLPLALVKGKTILDLGSCLGAAGYYVLHNQAKHYTGVEVQDYYFNTSNHLLSKYFTTEQFNIVQQDIIEFLDSSTLKFDIVLASGILYGFLDPIDLLQKLTKVTNEYLVIDTRYVPVKNKDYQTGIVLVQRKERMVKAIDENQHGFFEGIGSRICINALDIVLNSYSFVLDEEVKVDNITDTFDSYNTILEHKNGSSGPLNFIVRYKKTDTKAQTLKEIILNHG